MPSDQTPRACAVCAYPASHRCAGCGKAFYCSKDHQKTAWGKHKRLCKMYQAANNGEAMPAANTFCGLCGRTGPLRTTTCCNRTVCDDYEKYQPMSYSHDSCARNHDRYTRCCYHRNEGHGGNDPLSCDKCDDDHEGEMATWYMTNQFNFLEDIERATPIPFLPTYCVKCGRQIKLNCESVVHASRGKECHRCSGGNTPNIPGKNTYMLNR